MSLQEIAKAFAAKSLPRSQVELAGEVPYPEVEPYRVKALAHVVEHLELPGFRKGKVPPDMALKKFGEQAVLEEALELFIKDFYPALVGEKKIDAVGRPEIKVTKLATGNPVGLTIVATVYPEVVLPKNWKTVGGGVALESAAPASDEEVQQTLESLQKNKQASAGNLPAQAGDAPLPELNDAFAQSLGAFANLEALKEQIKKGIGEEKARAARDARRGNIVDALLKDVQVEVPQLFVDSELEKIMSQMREDVERMGLKLEDYLKHAKKTEADIRNEFKDQAAKRAKLQLTLNKIAQEEKIEPESAAIEAEMKHALEHFPDANPELLKIHIETVLKNELVLKLLEGN